MVRSFPGPDRSIRMDDLRRGRAASRRYRNRRIGEFLKELDLAEGRSTGIPKILRAMEANGSPPPEFETDEDRTSFLIRLPVHPASIEQAGTKSGLSRDQVGTKSALSQHQVEILRKCLADTPLRDLITITGRTDRTKFRDQVLAPLLDDALIVMTIPDKPRSSNQKYRLTDKGRQVLQ